VIEPLNEGYYDWSSAATVLYNKNLIYNGAIMMFRSSAYFYELWMFGAYTPNFYKAAYAWFNLTQYNRKEGMLDLFIKPGRITTWGTFDDNASNFKRTDYLELDGNDLTGVISGSEYASTFAFYDSSKTLIGRKTIIEAGQHYFNINVSDIPVNAKYVILSQNLFDNNIFD